jgi:anti-anti-sigma factor
MSGSPIPVLKPPARLTAETVPLFARVTQAYLERSLILDLSETVAITSAGLGHLVMIGRSLSERGEQLAFAGGNKSVLRLLNNVGLVALMPHFRTVEEALTWMRTRDRENEA